MMERQRSEHDMKTGRLGSGSLGEAWASARPYVPFLFIWGGQWLASSVLGFWGQWREVEGYQPLTLAAAIALSVAALAFEATRSRRRPRPEAAPLSSRAGAPFLGAAALLAVLLYVQMLDWHVLPLLKGIALALGYIIAGARLCRPLLLLGLWMLMLTATVGYWYLGYATIVLDGFGGLSLIGAACLIILGYRGEMRT
ncbi:hypothetical protein O9H85_17175 [Paenibacillus filicis]|uniref:DUF2157 domain-containing protein n=1 Tax=Paenibacillus gyeongsangnamensis TaxID=3388067 RepID=A0ABT4QB99_9BACL|nr:hypothetical protein [Paenibacillus filicis]MCZ8514126.1 hypothetical protein [Paenibacillus filicis]